MPAINKRTATAVTLGVWIAGLGSAAALAYTLNRTPEPGDVEPRAAAPLVAAAAPAAPPPIVSELPSVLYVPPVTIVGSLHHSLASKAKTSAVDISTMHCTDWRGLDIGSGRVQVCE